MIWDKHRLTYQKFLPNNATDFPNIANYAFQAMHYDDNIMWARTKIRIVKIKNGSSTWSLLTESPNVLVWNLKIKEGQVIIATYGRRIWTAEIDELNHFNSSSNCRTSKNNIP